jgi:hypothetical protein
MRAGRANARALSIAVCQKATHVGRKKGGSIVPLLLIPCLASRPLFGICHCTICYHSHGLTPGTFSCRLQIDKDCPPTRSWPLEILLRNPTLCVHLCKLRSARQCGTVMACFAVFPSVPSERVQVGNLYRHPTANRNINIVCFSLAQFSCCIIRPSIVYRPRPS